MRTDDYGREIASANPRKSITVRGGRLFAFGIAVGVGVCFGMGPPAPLLDKVLSQAVASEPAVPAEHVLPRQWMVLRNALLDPSVTGAALSEQQADEQLLRGKWLALRDALATSWSDRLATR